MGSRRRFITSRSGTRSGVSPIALMPLRKALPPTLCRWSMRRENNNFQTALFSLVYSAVRCSMKNCCAFGGMVAVWVAELIVFSPKIKRPVI